MSILVCGSVAYDTIMVFHDRFKNHILPDQIHILNVAFLVPDMRREFGGCAGNIAYNLKLLGADPLIMATVGDDAAPYLSRLDQLGLRADHVRAVSGSFTAQAFITTDVDDNQITAFHPGAMNHSHQNRVSDAKGVKLGIVAPDGRDGMLGHAQQFAEAGIPFVFDPGQGLPMFSGPELEACLEMASYCALNDYEARMLSEKTGRSIEDLAGDVDALVVTLGAEGSQIYVEGQRIDIPCVKAEALVDPTGCGDAFRSGLLYGIANGMDWETTGRLASVMGSLKIAHRGGQNHRPSRTEIAERYAAAFGEKPW
ncbi:carbohydrate kinase family protein [Denitromonas sp.]|uniref:carbohydrate kinase family protein n=1 Tax=Denitromonas sp. TaxID=2734609 RepID=UPI002AFEB15F|nr:carbohydrate kinase family protein [Denitromonas sp.]